MARVLVAGCGYVGTALGEALAAAGHEVFGLRRRPEALPAGLVPLAADLSDPTTLRALPRGLELVFYTAAADGFDDDAYRTAYVDGLRNLLSALTHSGESPRRVLFTSSTAVYAQAHGEWVDERAPTSPESFSGRRVLEGEQLLRSAPFASIVLRLGGIYGPGRTRLLESVREGRATCRGGLPRYTNRIHRDDCAGALAHLAFLETPEALYLGVDCEPADECAVLRWLALRLRAPAPRVADRDTEASARARGSKRCSNARLVATGYRFRFPTFREGYGELTPPTGGLPGSAPRGAERS